MSGGKKSHKNAADRAQPGSTLVLSRKNPAVRNAAIVSVGNMGFFIDWLSMVYEGRLTRNEIIDQIYRDKSFKPWLEKFKRTDLKVKELMKAAMMLVGSNVSDEKARVLKLCMREHRWLRLAPDPTKEQCEAYLQELRDVQSKLTPS